VTTPHSASGALGGHASPSTEPSVWLTHKALCQCHSAVDQLRM